MAKSALQQIYSKLNQNQDALGLAIAAYKKISGSPLFDPIYYTKRYNDVADSGLEPLVHYVVFGATEGRSPHPLFNSSYYKEQLSAKGIRTNNPLKHYLDSAATSELWPNRLFDPKHYRSQISDEVTNPVEHFLTVGVQKGFDPFPLFDTSFYLAFHKDVQASQINPLVHYLLVGAYEGRAPHYLFDAEHYAQSLGIQNLPYLQLTGNDANEVMVKLIDKALEINPDPDNPTRINPVFHYLQYGATEERNPHPVFSTRFYLLNNPDVRESGVNPLAHYILEGQKQHRKPHELFDPKFYLENLPTPSQQAQLKPLEHFLNDGGVKGVPPHPLFDPAFYCSRYPDTVAHKINPLAHYLKIESFGHRLIPNKWFDGLFYGEHDPEIASTKLSALEHYIAYGASERRSRNFLDLAKKTGVEHGFVEEPVGLDQLNFEKLKAKSNVAIVLFGPALSSDFLKCLYGLTQQTADLPFQVVVAGQDNDVTTEIAKAAGLTLLAESAVDESEACNLAAHSLSADVLIFLRKNFQVLRDWLVPLVTTFVNNEKPGIVCSTTLSPLGRILNAGASLSDDAVVTSNLANHYPFDVKEIFPVAVAPRGSFAISGALFAHLKGFDTTIRSALYQDVDLSHRAKLTGAENICQPLSRVINQTDYGSETHSGHTLSPADADEQARFYKRWLVKA